MFDVPQYLDRIGYTGPTDATAETLRGLQKRHLMAIPYNSDGIPAIWSNVGYPITMDLPTAYSSCVLGGRGGICLQLNRLFGQLLQRLGFEVALLAGNTYVGQQWFEHEIEHMFLQVTLDGERWLVDAGSPGPSYLEPLRLTDEVQEQYGSRFRLVADGAYTVIQRQGADAGAGWKPVYRFKQVVRELADWDDTGRNWWAFQPGTSRPGAQMTLMGRAFANGQVTLQGRRLITVVDGREEVRTLVKTAVYRSTLDALVAPADLQPDLLPR
jgi:amide synthase